MSVVIIRNFVLSFFKNSIVFVVGNKYEPLTNGVNFHPNLNKSKIVIATRSISNIFCISLFLDKNVSKYKSPAETKSAVGNLRLFRAITAWSDVIPSMLYANNEINHKLPSRINKKITGKIIFFFRTMNISAPSAQRMASEKSAIESKRDGWADEMKGMESKKGIFAINVGRLKIRERKKSVPKNNVFLSLRKHSAKIAMRRGIIPTYPINSA